MTVLISKQLADLPAIERELACSRPKLRFAADPLEDRFQAEQREQTRLQNLVTVVMLVVFYDVFLVAVLHAAPEAAGVAMVFRLCFLTPAALLFVWLDRSGVIGPWHNFFVCVFLIAPTALCAVEATWTTSPAAMSYYQSAPLILLTILTCRLSLAQVATVNFISCALFIWTMLTGRFVSSAAAPSLIVTDVAMGIGTLIFTWRIDLRDRKVFLLNLQADFKNDLLARQNLTLARLTQVDALTGLGNRRCFDETLAAIWADERMQQADITLIMLDIDCFKLFNDSFGHQAGDECLATLGYAAAHCLRDDRDTLVRYGGEEFAIILPATSLAEGWSVAERVRQAALDRAVPQAGGGASDIVTVSLGVASVKPAEQSSAALIEMADRCLYAAKRGGRNRTVTEDMMQECDPFPIERLPSTDIRRIPSGSPLAAGRS